MGRLSDILNGNAGNFHDVWSNTAAAADFGPLPKGVYVAHATRGELETNRTKGTPGYKIEFTIIEGQYIGRKLWLDLWLTAAALPASKRDLAKLGINSPADLERPLPRYYRCKVTAVVRKDDTGIQRNEIRAFEVLGLDRPTADPFAPPSANSAGPPMREPGDEADEVAF